MKNYKPRNSLKGGAKTGYGGAKTEEENQLIRPSHMDKDVMHK
jgi:hypothetical protein